MLALVAKKKDGTGAGKLPGDHPNSNYEAIMSYSNNGKVDRLGLDDMAGLTSL